jgi:hypothetical protein
MPQRTGLGPISSRRCRSSRCGKIAPNFAARFSLVTTMLPIPHQHAAFQEATGYFPASSNFGLVLNAFPLAHRANRVALLSAVGAAAAGLRPSLGGLLVTAANWRLVFLVNLPIGVAAVLLARRRLIESRRWAADGFPTSWARCCSQSRSRLVLGIVRAGMGTRARTPITGCLAVALAVGALVTWRYTWHARR